MPPGRDPKALARALSARHPRDVRHEGPRREGNSGMRIGADGTWYYLGSPIRRPEMVRLFARVLQRDPDGYALVTPVEKLSIEVEDAPFVAVDFDQRGGPGADQRLVFVTNVDDRVVAGPRNPLRMGGGGSPGEARAYVTVRPGLEARLSRAAWYRLAELAEVLARDGREVAGVWSDGVFFTLSEDAPD